MLYVGLDVHQMRSSICILDDNGKTVKQELIRGPWPQVINRLRGIEAPMSVCYEASCGYGHLYDRIAPLASDVAVAHPGQLRVGFDNPAPRAPRAPRAPPARPPRGPRAPAR